MRKKESSVQLEGQVSVEQIPVPVRIGGYRQNVYRKDTTGIISETTRPNRTQEKYVSLEKKTLPNGYVEELVLKDYPINSDSVSSFADGADYRNDPAQAIAQAPQRVNLGDITEAQAFLENPQSKARLFNDVKAKLEAYYKSVTEKTAETPPADPVSEGGVNNG